MLRDARLMPATVHIALDNLRVVDECQGTHSLQRGPLFVAFVVHATPPDPMEALLGIQPVTLQVMLQPLVEGTCTSKTQVTMEGRAARPTH